MATVTRKIKGHVFTDKSDETCINCGLDLININLAQKCIGKEEKQKLRILRAMAQTPFAAGLASFPRSEKEIDSDCVAKWIEELAERLREHSKGCSEQSNELSELKRQLGMTGQLFRKIMEISNPE